VKPTHIASSASLVSLALALALACSDPSPPAAPATPPAVPEPIVLTECDRMYEELAPILTDSSCATDDDCDFAPHAGCNDGEPVNRHGLERERERVDAWATRCVWLEPVRGRCKAFIPRCVDRHCTREREQE
jgi:hypothetical protein